MLQQLLELTHDNSNDQFIINFGDAWKSLGYCTKGHAKLTLKCLDEGKDYISKNVRNGQRGRPVEEILLTTKGFKLFAMMSTTPGGKIARRYFIDSEKRAKEILKQGIITPEAKLELIKAQLNVAIALESEDAIQAFIGCGQWFSSIA
jgi:phage anti-repressor protein